MTARLAILSLFLLGGCFDQPYANNFGSTTPPRRQAGENTTLGEATTPVRVGESGPNFRACTAQGEMRDRTAEGLVVRAAPFEQAQQTGLLAPGATFFVCSRSMDQRWIGIVFERPGRATDLCGVSTPASRRRDYDGPCDSGWVASAQVRTVSGVERAPVEANGNSATAK